jgi:hypothetical protein
MKARENFFNSSLSLSLSLLILHGISESRSAIDSAGPLSLSLHLFIHIHKILNTILNEFKMLHSERPKLCVFVCVISGLSALTFIYYLRDERNFEKQEQ